MGLVYATQFQVNPETDGEPDETSERLGRKVLDWAEHAIRQQIDRRTPASVQVPQFGKVPVEGGKVEPLPGFSIEVAHAMAASGDAMWRMVYIIPDDKQDHLQWIATASVTRKGGELEFDFSLDVRPTSFVVTPRMIQPGTPSIIREIIEAFDCQAGGVRLSTEPVVLHDADIESFARDVLPSTRRLPVVLLSAGSPRRPYRTEGMVAPEVVGLAHVYAIDNTATEDRLIAALGNRALACWGGGVRTYWPGFTTKDPPWRHRVASPELIAELGAEGFAKRLRASLTRLAAANYAAGSLYGIVKKEVEGQIQARSEARYSDLQRQSKNVKELQSRVEELLGMVHQKDDNNAELRKALDAQEERITELESQLREQVYSGMGEERAEPSSTPPSPLPWPLPWEVENPMGTTVSLSATFEDDMKVLHKDGSLRGDFLAKLSGVLRDPWGVGQSMRAPRVGQRSTHVSHNYRLVWTPVDHGARLELFCSKEDPRYSPFGA